MTIGYVCISETKLIRRQHRVLIPPLKGRHITAETVQGWLAQIPKSARLTDIDVRDDEDDNPGAGVYLTFTEEIAQP